MLRPVFSCLLLAAVLSTSNALAQQSRSGSAKKPADSWGAEPAPAAPAASATAPAASSGFAAPAAAPAADIVPQSNGFAIAPGFTAAPSHRVRMDYRGRPMAPYVKRNVSVNTSTTAPAPMVEAPSPVAAPAVTTTEVAAPVAAPATKSTATSATATKKVASASAAPAAAPKAAPAKKAPAKKVSNDGWGSSSGSGW